MVRQTRVGRDSDRKRRRTGPRYDPGTIYTVHERVLSDARHTSNELQEGEPVGGGAKCRLGTYVFSMHGHASRFNATTLDKAHSRRYGEPERMVSLLSENPSCLLNGIELLTGRADYAATA